MGSHVAFDVTRVAPLKTLMRSLAMCEELAELYKMDVDGHGCSLHVYFERLDKQGKFREIGALMQRSEHQTQRLLIAEFLAYHARNTRTLAYRCLNEDNGDTEVMHSIIHIAGHRYATIVNLMGDRAGTLNNQPCMLFGLYMHNERPLYRAQCIEEHGTVGTQFLIDPKNLAPYMPLV